MEEGPLCIISDWIMKLVFVLRSSPVPLWSTNAAFAVQEITAFQKPNIFVYFLFFNKLPIQKNYCSVLANVILCSNCSLKNYFDLIKELMFE